MPLIPKITVLAVDNLTAQSVTLQDSTGAYNVSTNPGGYGSPNYATSDVTYALLQFRNYQDQNYSTQKLTSPASILGAGQIIPGLTDGKFQDGVWELKYYPVIGRPTNPSLDTTITWTAGSKTFTLASASTVLAGVTAIILKNISDTTLYFLDPAVPPTSGQATVTDLLPAIGTASLALAYQADTRFYTSVSADDCLAKDTDRLVKECSCFDPEMQGLYLRMGKRNGVDIHFTKKGNYQAAHDLIIQLGTYCANLSNCGCK